MRVGGSGKGGGGEEGRGKGRGREAGRGGRGGGGPHRYTDTPIHRAILPAQIGVSASRRICLLDRRIGVSAYLLLDRRIGVSRISCPDRRIGVSAYRRIGVFPARIGVSAYRRMCPLRAMRRAYRRIGARRFCDTICRHAGTIYLTTYIRIHKEIRAALLRLVADIARTSCFLPSFCLENTGIPLPGSSGTLCMWAAPLCRHVSIGQTSSNG